MMRIILQSLLQLFFWLPLWAQEVTVEEAKLKATSFFLSRMEENSGLKSGEVIRLDPARIFYTEPSNSLKSAVLLREPAFFLFDRADRNGFVMIAADERVNEILAWSETSAFCETPPQLKTLLDQYVREITLVKEHPVSIPVQLKSAVQSQEPLLGNIEWSQSPDPYNSLCPLDPSTGRKCQAGCVATALAQVIRYYMYPRVGTGSHGYMSAYGYLSADFSASDYRYWLMDEKPLPGIPNPEIAELTYHCGIALEMEYGPYGSGAWAGMIPPALENYFKYKKSSLMYKSQYSHEEWEAMLKEEIVHKRPVIYSALDPKDPDDPEDVSAGHAFVVDGYDEQGLFHINWGWEGCSNGYYALGLLNPANCGNIYTFSDTHSAVVGIEPLSGFECLFSLGTDSLSFVTAGGAAKIDLFANSDWRVDAKESWIEVTPSGGKDSTEITVEALPYNGFLGRYGTVTLISCNVTRKIVVFQEGTCKIALSASAVDFPDTASIRTLEVASTASWIITGKPSWVQVTPVVGNGNEVLTLSVPAFTGFGERSGTLTVSGCSEQKQVSLTQKGSCLFTLSSQVCNFGHEAGEELLVVSTNSSWSGESNASWITVTPSAASGNGTLSVKVGSNEGLAGRSGMVTLRVCDITRTITVNQKGNCNLSTDPVKLDFEPEAGVRTVTVSSNSTWSASSADYWIGVTPGSGKENGSLKISVPVNHSTSNRSGQVTITGCNTIQKIAVVQKSHSTLDLSASTLDFSYMPGSKSTSVTATNFWIATSDAPWVTITPKYGYRSGNITVSVDVNQGESVREANLSFSDGNLTRILTVRQDACLFTLSGNQLTFKEGQESSQVTIGSKSLWSASVIVPWIRLSSRSGMQGETVTVSVDANEGEKRSDWITISGCFTTKRIEVVQEGVSTAAHDPGKGKFRIYPLPADRFVTVEFAVETQGSRFVELFTETGSRIFLRELYGNKEILDLKGCSPGLYFMRISGRGFAEVARVVLR